MDSRLNRNAIMFLGLTIFCIMFSNNILYQLKNWYIMKNIGPEVLPLLASVSFTVAVPITIFYGYLTNQMPLEKVFKRFIIMYEVILIFIMFILIPNEEYFHFNTYESFNDTWLEYPSKMLSKWGYIVLYILSEFWSSMLYTVSLWNIINTTFNANESKKYYNYFGGAATLGMMSSGLIAYVISKFFVSFSNQEIAYILTIIVLISSRVAYYSMSKIQSSNIISVRQSHLKIKNTNTSLGLIDSITHIMSSHYLFVIFLLSILLGILSINMEYIAQPSIKAFTKSLNAFDAASEKVLFERYHLEILLLFSSLTFFMSTLSNVLCQYVFKRFGWVKAAAFIPTITSIFSLCVILSIKSEFEYTTQITVLAILAINSIRYSFGDVLPEVLYQPLDKENQSKGKACIKTAQKSGKFLGTAILAFITMWQRSISIILAVVTIFVISFFIFVIIFIAKQQYNKLAKTKEIPLL